MKMENKEDNQEIGHVYIPAHIMQMENLTLSQKVLFGKIVGLSGKEGYCYALNGWLGKQIKMSKSMVSNTISKFVKLGILRREVERDENKRIIKRKLYPFNKIKVIPITPRSDTPITPRSEYIQDEYIQDKEIIEISNKLNISLKIVKDKYEDLKLYCSSNGKKYKNYKAALYLWLKKDLRENKIMRLPKYEPYRDDKGEVVHTLPEVERLANLKRIKNMKNILLQTSK